MALSLAKGTPYLLSDHCFGKCLARLIFKALVMFGCDRCGAEEILNCR